MVVWHLTIVRWGWVDVVAAAKITLYHKVREKSRLVGCWQLTRAVVGFDVVRGFCKKKALFVSYSI